MTERSSRPSLGFSKCIVSGMYRGFPPELASLPFPGSLAGCSYPLGDGRWRHSDIAGSLHEWTLDLYSDVWYSNPDATLDDPLNIAVGGFHPLRGGSFENVEALMRAASRHDSSQPNSRSIGLRCAR